MFQRVNYGPLTNAKNRGLRDLSAREWAVIAPMCAIAIYMGIAPGVFLRPMEASVRKTVEHVIGSGQPQNARETGSWHWVFGGGLVDSRVPKAEPRAPQGGLH